MINLTELSDPGASYRAAPFWSWNDILDEKELCRQIDLMKQGGWGGFFMHARVGLKTRYLGRKWFTCIRACIKKAHQIGMVPYLYDEDCWPSGYAGGRVPLASPKYRSKSLICVENARSLPATATELKAFDLNCGPNADSKNYIESENGAVRICCMTAPMGNTGLKGYCYVDFLRKESIKKFLATTHEMYRKQLDKKLFSSAKAIFTDEPCYLFDSDFPRPGLPWSERLPEEFHKRRGYDLVPRSIELFYDVGHYMKTRYDFHLTVVELFEENFSQPMFQWCTKNKLPLTGHFMAENGLIEQTQWIGSAMTHYQYMHIPGMDHLGTNIIDPIVPKQVSSVANQMGRRRRMSETYGASGQGSTFADWRWIWNWHAALGINFEVPHLWLYSMRGERKRDWPPTISYQQPYWRYNKAFSDYTARVNYIMSLGQEVNKLLVISPIESVWALYTPPRGAGTLTSSSLNRAETTDRQFARLIQQLLCRQTPFDLGDEAIIARHGKVRKDKLHLKHAAYDAVLLPRLLTLRSSTVKLLTRFVQQGGKLYLCGRPPGLIDGQKQPEVVKPFLNSAQRIKIPQDIDKLTNPDIIIKKESRGSRNIFIHQRQLGDEKIFFLTNIDKNHGHTISIIISPRHLFLYRINFEKGLLESLSFKRRGQKTELTLHFDPAGAHCLLSTDRKIPAQRRTTASYSTICKARGHWRIQLLDPNALTVDRCRLNHGKRRQYVLSCTRNARKFKEGQPLDIHYDFRIEDGVKLQDIFLAVEKSDHHRIIVVNRNVLSKTPLGYYIDKSFEKYDISGLVVPGQNKVTLRTTARKEVDIEAIYIVGDFGVINKDGNLAVTKLPEKASSLNLQNQGLPFFAGQVVLEKEITVPSGATALKITGAKCATIEVALDDLPLGKRLWMPFIFTIPKKMTERKIKLRITLTNTLRNLLGPHHTQTSKPGLVSPAAFESNHPGFSEDYFFEPFGFKQLEFLKAK